MRPPIPEDGEGFLDRARALLTPEDRKAVETWLGKSKALRSTVPLLAVLAAVEIAIAFAWQSGEQRSADLLIAAGAVILMLVVWRVRYLEELYERAHRQRAK